MQGIPRGIGNTPMSTPPDRVMRQRAICLHVCISCMVAYLHACTSVGLYRPYVFMCMSVCLLSWDIPGGPQDENKY